MSILGILFFLAGWIYAIVNFGFFLGVGLGWIPAIIIAWIFDFLLVSVLGLSSVVYSTRKNRSARPVRSKISSVEAPKPRVKFGLMITVLVVAFMAYLGLRNELQGKCDRLAEDDAALCQLQDYFHSTGVSLDDLRNLDYGSLYLKYGAEIAENRWRLTSASFDVAMSEAALEWPGICF